MTQITISAAGVEDIPTLLCLINAAGAGLPLQAWSLDCRAGQNPWDRGRELMLDERSGIHISNSWLARTPQGGYGGLVLYVAERHGDRDLAAESPFMRPIRELEAEAEGTAHVSYLCTLDGFRGQGIGSALLRFSESFRSRRGMSVTVSSANRKARNLYERFGYSDRMRRRMVWPSGTANADDWILMCKP